MDGEKEEPTAAAAVEAMVDEFDRFKWWRWRWKWYFQLTEEGGDGGADSRQLVREMGKWKAI